MKRNSKLIQPNELSDSVKSSMKTRTIAGIIGLIPCVLGIFVGDWLFFALILFAVAVCVYEILGVVDKRNPPVAIAYFITLALITFFPVIKGLVDKDIENSWHIYVYFTQISVPLILLIVGVFVLFLLAVLYTDFTVRDACFLFTLGLMIAFGLQSLLFLRFNTLTYGHIYSTDTSFLDYKNTVASSLLLIYVVLATFGTDIGAYFTGVLFGKHRMNERISPKKTWEGFWGGIIISIAVSLSFGLSLAFTGHPIHDILDKEHWYYILILSIILPFVATLGDFVFSSIKRYYGIKDYGTLIPGHGGIIDRLDSIFFTMSTSALFITFVSNLALGLNPLV